MKKLDIFINKAFFWFFAIWTVGAIAAVCVGATHHWVTALCCGIMAFVLYSENKKG